MGRDEQQTVDRGSRTDRLIALGRDREAVASATRDLPYHLEPRPDPDGQGAPMDPVQQLDEVITLLRAVVGEIDETQLENPTACEKFTVTGVLEHMIGGAGAFVPAFRGAPGVEPAPADAPGTVQEEFLRSMDDLAAAVRSPGAQERTITAPFGEVPGSVFTRFVAFDGLVHGWDLATATGQPYEPPRSLVAEIDDFARDALAPAMRDGDTFAAATEPPPGASRLEQLVAFTGRSLPSMTEGR